MLAYNRNVVIVALLTVAGLQLHGVEGCPTGMTPLPDPFTNVCIDIYESAVHYFDATIGGWALHPFNIPVDSLVANNVTFVATSPFSFSSGEQVRPQGYISQAQASQACRASGRRLCMLEEWESGCGGTNRTTYPYGNVYHHGYCNEGHESPIQRLFGPNPTYNWTEMNDPRCDNLTNTLRRGGEHSNCTNAEVGTFDMSGNLDEWTGTLTNEGHGIFKGGYFVDAVINGPGCRYTTTAHATYYHDYSLGFRCCMELKDPSTGSGSASSTSNLH